MLNPIEHSHNAEATWQYGVEPYVVAADVYRLPGRVGQGGWTWYTGSAAWLYRAWIEEVLGLQLHNGTIKINPVIPGSWPGYFLSYRHGETIYEINVENPDGCERGVIWIEMDGQRMADCIIILEQTQLTHQVVVMMGNTEQHIK
jgi:cyclic beta-1,2-glucan synthetase